jgi:hypothetical protein
MRSVGWRPLENAVGHGGEAAGGNRPDADSDGYAAAWR